MSDPDSVISADCRHELMEEARRAPPGDIVEVGVYKGGSAAALMQVCREQDRRLHLFDTFTGIPYACDDDTHKVGDFADTSLAAVRQALPEAFIYPGIFPGTLPAALDPIALAHVDCDQYQSVLDCCVYLSPLMAPGGVMVFDDYDVLPGARLAVQSYFMDRVLISRMGKARVYF
jgi:O-methyltransferase